MTTFDETTSALQQLLQAERLEEAEQLVDKLAASDPAALGATWDLSEGLVLNYLSIFYNNIGMNYQGVSMQAQQQGERDSMLAAARDAERCHEKALDIHDMPAEDFQWFPSQSPFTKNLICTFWGLGTVKYVLDKKDESRKYLRLCVEFPAEDEQAGAWHADASNYLRMLDGQPVRIVLKAQEVMPNMFNPQLLRVQGDLLDWDAYAPPTLKEYAVLVSDDDIERLEAQGFQNALALVGCTLVLTTDESGDLRRPLRIVDVL